MNDPFQDPAFREMFRDLLASLEREYGPIKSFSLCHYTEPGEVQEDEECEELVVDYPEEEPK